MRTRSYDLWYVNESTRGPKSPMQTDVRRREYLHGIDLFNRGVFFDAHEVLEDVWRAAPEPEKKFLQGLIQVAVALHHHSRGNIVGCRSLLARAQRNLSLYPSPHQDVNLAALHRDLLAWIAALEQDRAVPPLPRIGLSKER